MELKAGQDRLEGKVDGLEAGQKKILQAVRGLAAARVETDERLANVERDVEDLKRKAG